MQVNFLKKFIPKKPLSNKTQQKSIFCGSGDSLAASLLAESFSDLIVRAADPLDLLKNIHLVKNKSVYFVSISGNTISNIKVAKKSENAIAITSKQNSRLAKACKNTILLTSPKSDIFTAGSISFLESALTCISLVKSVKIQNPAKIFNSALEQSRVNLTKRVFVIGNLHSYPVAMYCAAKFYEVLGQEAYYERIEQFSHMELFSTKRGDTVIIFEKKNKHNSLLSKKLQSLGLNVIHPKVSFDDKLSQIIFYIFYSQIITLQLARKLKKREVNFMVSDNFKKVSDEMIY